MSPVTAAGLAAAAEAPWLHALARIDGVDVDRGLANVGGRPATLARVWRTFVRVYAHNEPARESLQGPADPLEACRAAAHSIKGACATLGAHGLMTAAQALEAAAQAAHDPADVVAQACALDDALARLVAAVDAALPPV